MKALALVAAIALSSCTLGVDFMEGRGYACSLDAGSQTSQCAAGWRCGLEGYCHREGDAKPWQCNDTAACEGDWVCGLERVCHDPSVVTAYVCTDDRWCAGGWRCGFEGRCVDPGLEVGPIRDFVSQPPEVLAPRVDLRADAGPRFVTLVGASLPTVVVGRGSTVDVFTAASAELLATEVRHFDAGSPVEAVASQFDVTWVLAGGEVLRWDNQGRFTRQLVLDGGPAMLRVGTEPYLRAPEQLHQLPAYSGAVAHPIDATAFDATVMGPCRFQLTPLGLFSANLATPAWSALALDGSLANTACGSDRNPRINSGHFRVNPNGLLAIVATPQPRTRPMMLVDGGGVAAAGEEVSLYDATGLLAASGATLPCDIDTIEGRCGAPRTTTLLGPCRSPCMFGQRVSDVRGFRSAAGVGLEVECTSERGQSTWSLSGVGAECAAGLLTGRSTRYADVRRDGFGSADFSRVMQFGEHGQAWVGETFSKARAIFLDEVPLGPARLLLTDGGAVTGWVASETVAVPNAALGLLNLPGADLAAVVDGTDDWVVDSSGLLVRLADSWRGGARELLGALDVRADAFKPPIRALRVATDGGATVVVTVNDAVYAASADPAQLASRDVPLRIVPQPGVAITSVAVVPGDPDGGSALRGYLSTRTSVMSFTTRGTSWSVQSVTMPQGTVSEVWADEHGNARAGFDDGRVVTLPSRIPIAPPIGSDLVVDYLYACGQTWALTPSGVLRLVGGSASAGTWVDWPLTGPSAVVLDGLADGHLFAANGRVYVFNAFGNAVSFAPSGCR